MTDEQILEQEFADHGFLAEHIQWGINAITAENSEWFSLLRDANHTLQKMVIAGSETHYGKTLDPVVLATFSGFRSLGNLQAAVMMLERGMIAEARIMVRCLFENSFCMAALAEAPTAFISMLKIDNRAARRGQAATLKEGKYNLSEAVQAAVDAMASGKGSGHLNWKEIANLTSISRSYLHYKYLSDDSSHYSASSLNRYLITDKITKTWSGYSFGPGSKEEVFVTANLCASATLSIIVGYSQITGERSYDDEINLLLDRYQALNAIKSDGLGNAETEDSTQ
jgi:hypothetical protein